MIFLESASNFESDETGLLKIRFFWPKKKVSTLGFYQIFFFKFHDPWAGYGCLKTSLDFRSNGVAMDAHLVAMDAQMSLCSFK